MCFKMCFIGYLICLRRSPLGALMANVDFLELSCLCDHRRRDHHGPVVTPRSISPVRCLLKCKVTCKLTSYTPLKSIFLRHFYRFPKQPVCFFRHLNIAVKVANCPLVSHLWKGSPSMLLPWCSCGPCSLFSCSKLGKQVEMVVLSCLLSSCGKHKERSTAQINSTANFQGLITLLGFAAWPENKTPLPKLFYFVLF